MNDANNVISDAENLEDFRREVQIGGGESITITNFKFGKIFRAKELFVKFVDDFESIFDPGKNGPIQARGLKILFDLETLVEKHLPEIREIITLETGKSDAWLDGLDPDVVVKLLIAIFEVNVGFFAQRLLPHFRGIRSGVASLVQTKS